MSRAQINKRQYGYGQSVIPIPICEIIFSGGHTVPLWALPSMKNYLYPGGIPSNGSATISKKWNRPTQLYS